MEQWRPVPGYEGLYEVSDLGRVKSVNRLCEGGKGYLARFPGKLLKPQTCLRGGYLEVSLSKDGKRKHRTIHSLVAEAFLGARPEKYDVMHLDGNRKNNTLSNLRYGSRADNLHQTYEYGGAQAAGKLTADDVHDIRKRLSTGSSPSDLAKEYGVNSAAIYHIRNGTTFKWLAEEVV